MDERPGQSFSSSTSSGTASRRVKAEAEAHKDNAAGRMDDVANAVDRAADELHDNPTLSRYAADLADSVHGIATRMRERSVDDLAEELRQLARRNPGVFVLGSLGAGFALARFMKASPRRDHRDRSQETVGDRSWDDVRPGTASAAPDVPLSTTGGTYASEAAFPATGTHPPRGPDLAAPRSTDTGRT